MKNEISSGDQVDLVAPSGGVTSGGLIKIGAFIGVPVTTALEGDTFTLKRKGEFDVTAEGAGSGQAWTAGDIVYWDDTNKRVTKTSSANTKCGIATAAKITTGVIGRLVLVPAI